MTKRPSLIKSLAMILVLFLLSPVIMYFEVWGRERQMRKEIRERAAVMRKLQAAVRGGRL